MTKGTKSAFLIFLILFLLPKKSYAILPPELVSNIWTSLSQVIIAVITFMGLPIIYFWKYIKKIYKKHKIVVLITAILLVSFVFSASYFYISYQSSKLAKKQVNLVRETCPFIFRDTPEIYKLCEISGDPEEITQRMKDLGYEKLYGVSAIEFAKILKNQEDIIILDTRNSIEYNLGHLKNAQHFYYKDLNEDSLQKFDKNKPIFIYCFMGWRGPGFAISLAKRGYNAKYIIGGVPRIVQVMPELWKGEDFIDFEWETIDDLTDTKTVIKHLKNNNLSLIDPRHHDEFENSHLPGAINISVAELEIDQINNAISKIEKDKYVAIVCYDKFSCFQALVLNYQIALQDYDTLGRYTTPEELEEYFNLNNF